MSLIRFPPIIAAAMLFSGCAKSVRIANPGKVPRKGSAIELPTVAEEDRFFAVPVTSSGAKLKLLADTGGGLWLSAEAAGAADRNGELRFRDDAAIPPPIGATRELFVRPPSDKTEPPAECNGMLGQAWFDNRSWVLDYAGGRIFWRADGDVSGFETAPRATLGFKRVLWEKLGYPRMTVEIDGRPHEMLFDTGATLRLTEPARLKFADGRPAYRATSFMCASVFDEWHKRHPDWRFIDEAEQMTRAAIIEVPSVKIAGQSVGPVWFTRRADKNFHEWMSQWTDQRIDGAIGGSALKYFRILIDYRGRYAAFLPAAHMAVATRQDGKEMQP